ncbi:MAG: hypothetical protein FWC93_02110 [Defluviitaleaceae bacterium]|nr:hypothetical protein [Defluviitaleaceae bacterium]
MKHKVMMPKNFHITDILECGQCFRFQRLDDMHYLLVANGRALHVKQNKNELEFWYDGNPLYEAEFVDIWVPYFDLGRDYAAILTKITHDDPVMQTAANFAPGIRILAQDPWEALISFIISANNRIPQIKQVVENISRRYGTHISGENYAFPTIEQLAAATPEDLRQCKTGFRDKYILDAAQKAAAGMISMRRDVDTSTDDLRKTLLAVNGVGEKVAHCVLLFGYGRFDTFPVDTWVKRVMEQYYFDGKPTTPAQIHMLAQERFGPLSGFAQQYLFHYIRTKGE